MIDKLKGFRVYIFLCVLDSELIVVNVFDNLYTINPFIIVTKKEHS